jgi:hypothetical protein
MTTSRERDGGALTPYEREQVRAIAAFKSAPPNPFAEMFKRVTLPAARAVERLIPDALVQQAIERAYDASQRLAGRRDIARRAGVDDIAELRGKPLEECDRLAGGVDVVARGIAVAEGVATGAGGPLTTLIDVPLLFVLAIRTILRIGHCYGYALDGERDRKYVLGLLLAATSNSLEVRRARLARLRDIEHWLLEETQQEILAEEAASFLFQLEVFEEVPGVGAASGAALNLTFLRRINLTARRVFQERWLRDAGKVAHIEPAEAPVRALAAGWTGTMTRAVYRGAYYVGFGATLPAWLVARWLRPMDNALTRGARDGASAAIGRVDRVLARASRPAAAIEAPTPGLAPA